tara:strand:+ start:806 stop:1585 length:780 start_codon:yes stop_codon:yes gene_type:complete
MYNVLPSGVPGLDIDLVIYNYTPIKEAQDDMIVHIQNENANGTGYIFRESDDWSGLQGGIEIRKVVPVIPTNRSQWGGGSIEVEGIGTVDNTSVIYNYRVDPCYNPQFDPNCPSYKVQIPEIETVDLDSLYDPLEDETVKNATASTDADQYDDKDAKSDEDKAKEEEEEKDSKERLEKALASADNTIMFAEAFAQDQLLQAMNMAINMSPYYSTSIDGGAYQDSVTLADKQLPENKRGLRNGLAQQLLHDKMIEMQYNK